MSNEWNREHPWSEVLDKRTHDYRTHDGKLGKHASYIWYRFVCNDPSCAGIIAVRSDDILAKAPSGFQS